MNDTEATRSFHFEQRKLVPASLPCETVESDEDYRLHYDQRDADLDFGAAQRKDVGRINPIKEPAARARQSKMWLMEVFHPLAESVKAYEERIAAGRLIAKRNKSL